MFSLEKISLTILRNERKIIEDLSFSLQSGDKIAVIGEEGNGKSSLFHVIANYPRAEKHVKVEGIISLKDEVVGYLPQMMKKEQLELSTEAYVNQQAKWLVFDYGEFYTRMSEMKLPSERIGPHLLMKDLSGGEKIKLQLLCEWMKKPTVMLLDEPSNDLDIETAEWLEKFILDLTIPVLFVSHDEQLLQKCANGILHFEQLKHKQKPVHTFKRLPYSEYVIDRQANFQRQTQKAKKEKEEFTQKMARYQHVYERVQHELRMDRSSTRQLKEKMKNVKATGKRFEREKEGMTEPPETEEEIFFQFSGFPSVPKGRKMIEYMSQPFMGPAGQLSSKVLLQVTGPKKVCIIGKNGSGKTTLLRAVKSRLDEEGTAYGYMPQNYSEEMDEDKTSVDFLTHSGDQEEHTQIRTFLGSMRFTAEEMILPLSQLSGGQKAKLFFLKMIVEKKEILILDEPTRNLSPLSGPEIRQALKDFPGCILAVSHDRQFISEVAEQIYLLDDSGLHLQIGN